MKTVDKVDKKFGRWTVLNVHELGRTPKLRVICDCGVEKIVLAKTIGESGKSQSLSCGCYHRERVKEALTLGLGSAAFNQIYSYYKTSARIRKIHFNLTKSEFKTLVTQNCYFCNIHPSNQKQFKSGNFIFNGIDRVDNQVGYLLTNAVPCCKACNYLKGRATISIMKKSLSFLENRSA